MKLRKTKQVMIGMFDSGIGGLSVLMELKKRAPNLDVTYWGDIKNAPYGTKKKEELIGLMAENIKSIMGHGATQIVNACNTMSAVMAFHHLQNKEHNVQIVEMVGPTVRALAQKKKQILVLATPATITSEIYQKEFERAGVSIKTKAIPKLAPAIEFSKSDKKQIQIIENALPLEVLQGVDVIALCCTHYPFAWNLFKQVLEKRAPHIELYNPAVVVAEEVVKQFGKKGKGKLRFFITQDSSVFRNVVAKNFTGSGYSITVSH